MGTAVPGTACPALRNRVHDAQDWLPDRQNRVQKGISAGRSVLSPRALSYSNTGCCLRQLPPTPRAPPSGRARHCSALPREAFTTAPLPTCRRRTRLPPPSPADESTPRRRRSRRATRHVCLHQPLPTSATHSLTPSTSRSRPCTRGAPSVHRRPQGPTAYRPVGAESRAEPASVRPSQMLRHPHGTPCCRPTTTTRTIRTCSADHVTGSCPGW
jgi:hypothetical protein